jgi:predicted transcriptional regulator
MPATVIETPGGERLVIVPEAEYRRLVAAAEGRNAKAETAIPADVANRVFAGENPVRVFREWRGLTARALARNSGISASHLSDIEGGRRAPSAEARQRLAAALDLESEDLEPANMD